MAKTILVSAGHSTVAPLDSGAVGNGYTEAREALRIRDAVADRLRVAGITVLEDGADGESQPLRKAIELAKRADVAVEIHFNAAASSSATGIEVLAKAKHKRLAQNLAGAIAGATGLKTRGDKGYKADNSGQHHRLGFCEAGGLIVEVAFISNANDMRAYAANFSALVENLAEVLAVEVGVKLKAATQKNLAKAEEMNEEEKVHIVAPGDNLYAISRVYGVSLDRLMKLNKRKDGDYDIKPGEKIKLHGKI